MKPLDCTTLFENHTTMVVLAIAIVFDLIFKGFALWKAAKNDDKLWFIALLVFNTIGVFPILYLLKVKKSF
jgi:hypothetical protein